jgi:hypothetical protein
MAWLLLRGMRQDGSPLGRAWRWVMGCYLAQLMLWPYPLGYRAMAVLLPGACIWCWRGWSTFRGRAKPLLSALVVVFLAGNLVTNIHLSRREAAGLSQKGHLDELREVAAWLLRHAFASTQTAVGGEVPVFHLHHYTGRQFQEYIPASDARYAFSATPPPAQSSQPDLWLLTTSPTEAQPHQAEGRAAARTAFRSSRGHYEVYEAASKPRVPPP